ncbi:HAD-IA family hydrolase [Halobacillus salinus]|uniref:Phosphoglycolate phosphatase n=1 Tax=Halobacillus salinus TaxID=192814 RepID=A0A4Z0H4V2_9BACI|nr:HAD-IA family hydrolase [Halobacillus salinus]TGB04907.1 phosphoglycolate phosphatase [Halobacillus salinus]
MFKHIIWDFDGTLFDTYPIMARIFQSSLEEHGFHESIEEILRHMKVSMSQTEQHYKDKYSIDDAFLKAFHMKRKDIEVEESLPFKGIREICEYIYNSGRFNYLYTHRGSSSIDLLKKFDLYPFFQDFITSEHRFERKPRPDAINHLVKKHAMDTEQAIMIGDRDLDLLAGKNAGISSCYFTEETEENPHADYIITDFTSLKSII